MTKVIVDKEKLEKLLEVIGDDCPAEVFNEKISWCGEEFCVNCGEYDCIKKWLGAKELPRKKEIKEEYATSFERNKVFDFAYNNGFNNCLEEILGEDIGEDK